MCNIIVKVGKFLIVGTMWTILDSWVVNIQSETLIGNLNLMKSNIQVTKIATGKSHNFPTSANTSSMLNPPQHRPVQNADERHDEL